jgi:hypothetical protein
LILNSFEINFSKKNIERNKINKKSAKRMGPDPHGGCVAQGSMYRVCLFSRLFFNKQHVRPRESRGQVEAEANGYLAGLVGPTTDGTMKSPTMNIPHNVWLIHSCRCIASGPQTTIMPIKVCWDDHGFPPQVSMHPRFFINVHLIEKFKHITMFHNISRFGKLI